jgi:hypothetical protein
VAAPVDLAGWTPVALNLASGWIDWGDLRADNFAEPFFDQTIDRWAGGADAALVRTDLDALAPFDDCPECDPALLIFHLSRCGSTVLSRLLATLPQVVVVAEPAPLNALLSGLASGLHPVQGVLLLRRLVRALHRERHCVLKLSSWNVRRAALFRQAFPRVPAVWLQREPAAVMASLLASPAGWLALRRRPKEAEALFGPAAGAACDDSVRFAAHALAAMLGAAAVLAPDLVVDYRDLPDAAWGRVAPLFGVSPAAEDVQRMRREARYYAKDRGQRAFTGDPPERRALADSLAAVAEAVVAPSYRALDAPRSTG